MFAQAAGVIFALASAVAWGGADFCGGVASRRSHHLDVLWLSRVALVTSLSAMAVVTREMLPSMISIAWAGAGGACGAMGIAALYKGLATERSSLVVPAAGVVGAAIPVLFSAVVDGFLPPVQQVGLVVALAGIWLVSEGHLARMAVASQGLVMGSLAGLGFGAFFILLGQVEPGPVFSPLAVAAFAGLMVSLVVLAVARTSPPSLVKNPVALLTGVLDATGVVFYMLAIRLIRLDVAAVLGSLYPAIAVVLFWRLMKEHVAGTQWIGLVLCVVAIALIVV